MMREMLWWYVRVDNKLYWKVCYNEKFPEYLAIADLVVSIQPWLKLELSKLIQLVLQ